MSSVANWSNVVVIALDLSYNAADDICQLESSVDSYM